MKTIGKVLAVLLFALFTLLCIWAGLGWPIGAD
jgi:hypothetical protein